MIGSSGIGVVLFFLVGVLVLGVVYLVGWLVLNILRGLGWVLGSTGRLVGHSVVHVSSFLRHEVIDALHTAGAVLTAGVMTPLALLNTFMGRWGEARHYGRAVEDELGSAVRGVYRLAIGNPVRLLGLSILTEGVERRLPRVIDRAPRTMPVLDTKAFEGYEIKGTLPSGGSGARLYVARPLEDKLAELSRKGHADPGQVVIKSFAVDEGSTLPQIVRETRALEAASRLGLVLEHELEKTRFHYVMPFVPGEDLGKVTTRLHGRSAPEGLDKRRMGDVLGYAADILQSLQRFHREGLWHKDIKPTNLIVSRGHVQLVDLGLVTPLQSAMTLTTHGTEYYRDPEMVRLALRGVKVHEVDGVKFDLYSVGAVLYSMIENSFPAHGSLSRITKNCPEALQWIVRRSMADLATRYGAAEEMLADLRAVAAARDPYSLRPADLPSVQGELCGESAGLAAGPTPSPFAAPTFEPETLSTSYASTSPPTKGRRRLFSRCAPVSTPRCSRRRRARALATVAGIVVASGALASVMVQRFPDSHLAHRHTNWVPMPPSATTTQATSSPSHWLGREDRNPELERVERRIRSLQREWKNDLGPLLRRRTDRAQDAPIPQDFLVLETPGGELDREQREALEQALADYELSVLGSPSDDTSPTELDHLLASALHSVGLGDPDDDDSIDRLQAFLDTQDSLAGVLWLGAREGGEHRIARLLFNRSFEEHEPAIVVPRLANRDVELR